MPRFALTKDEAGRTSLRTRVQANADNEEGRAIAESLGRNDR